MSEREGREIERRKRDRGEREYGRLVVKRLKREKGPSGSNHVYLSPTPPSVSVKCAQP